MSKTVGPTLAASLKPLAYRQNVASLSFWIPAFRQKGDSYDFTTVSTSVYH